MDEINDYPFEYWKYEEDSMNNAEKLFGKNGELVELRKQQVLIGAAEILHRNCKEHCSGGVCDCVFAKFRDCGISYVPAEWELPEESNNGK